MFPFSGVVAAATLAAWAPMPLEKELPGNPDRAIEKLEQQTQELLKRSEELVRVRRRKLLDCLQKLYAARLKAGKTSQAQSLHDRIVLLEDVWKQVPAGGPGVSVEGLERAGMGGKYHKLVRALAVPDDAATYTGFNDFGFFPQTSYAGQNNIPAGYWIYVYPVWYVWEDGPARPDGP